MATDVEESDTDDHERPAPPKRQCTRLVGGNGSYEGLNQRLNEPQELANDSEECEYDKVEKLARERLSIWQDCQVAKGFLDNTINCVMERYILNPPPPYPDDPRFRLFRGNDMEDTAVMMAIRNHGLVNATDMLLQSQALCESRIHCSSNDREDHVDSCSSSRLPDADLSTLSLPSSSTIFEASRVPETESQLDYSENKMDESDREQDFLEVAVAEAIKKKGLSALSVDYG